MDKITIEKIDKKIRILNKKDNHSYKNLYDVIGIPSSRPLEALQNKCTELYNTLREKTDEISVLKKDLIGYAGDIFSNGESKQSYDKYIEAKTTPAHTQRFKYRVSIGILDMLLRIALLVSNIYYPMSNDAFILGNCALSLLLSLPLSIKAHILVKKYGKLSPLENESTTDGIIGIQVLFSIAYILIFFVNYNSIRLANKIFACIFYPILLTFYYVFLSAINVKKI